MLIMAAQAMIREAKSTPRDAGVPLDANRNVERYFLVRKEGLPHHFRAYSIRLS
jgi:hypothetical protein